MIFSHVLSSGIRTVECRLYLSSCRGNAALVSEKLPLSLPYPISSPLTPQETTTTNFVFLIPWWGRFPCAYVETPLLYCWLPCRSPASSLNSEFQAGTIWGAARWTFSLGYPAFQYDANPWSYRCVHIFIQRKRTRLLLYLFALDKFIFNVVGVKKRLYLSCPYKRSQLIISYQDRLARGKHQKSIL